MSYALNNDGSQAYGKELQPKGFEANGKLRSRDINVMVPSSHDNNKIIIGIFVVIASVLLASIAFWAIGASTDVVGLEIVGKVFFGLTIAAIPIALICIFGLAACS